MTLKKCAYIVVVCSILSACGSTMPLTGAIKDSDESFSGIATDNPDGDGNLTIISSKGASCTGNFAYVTRHQGQGVFECNDGRSGPFKFVSTGMWGTGYGQLGNSKLTFTFGS